MQKRTLALNEMKHDEELLEIRGITLYDVNKYRQNMREGDKFPMMIVDAAPVDGKYRICSGNLRYCAYKGNYGDDFMIEVEMRKFSSDREFYETAARENVTHGIPLTTISKKMFSEKLTSLGASNKDVAAVFSISEAIVNGWKANHVVTVVGKRKRNVIVRPLKRGTDIPTDSQGNPGKISEIVYAEHLKNDLGVPLAQLARQITRHLDNGWVNLNDAKTIEALKELKNAINNFSFGSVLANTGTGQK